MRIKSAFHLRIHVIAFADPGLVGALRIEMNDVPAALAVQAVATTYVLTARPGFSGPVTNGLKLRFRMPYSARWPNDPSRRRIGMALGGVEIVPEP